MNNEMQFPTAEEADALSVEFDRIASATLHELVKAHPLERTDIIMRGRDEGLSSPVRLGATVYVAHALDSDANVRKYDDPTDDELREVLARADAYTGDWYHSRVTLNYLGSWSSLQQQVAELEEESGVFIVFNYEASEALSGQFASLLNDER